jgi:hypothetical protein
MVLVGWCLCAACVAPDEVLVGYRNKLNKMESVMTQIKAAYSSFASATIASRYTDTMDVMD